MHLVKRNMLLLLLLHPSDEEPDCTIPHLRNIHIFPNLNLISLAAQTHMAVSYTQRLFGVFFPKYAGRT